MGEAVVNERGVREESWRVLVLDLGGGGSKWEGMREGGGRRLVFKHFGTQSTTTSAGDAEASH